MDVTFAGSPDRVEARLVPEAGFELDTFRVSGLPAPSELAARARARARRRGAVRVPADPRAAPSRRRPRRRRLRRRADGARGLAAPDPGRADRGRRAPRPREPARGAVRAAALPRVPDRRARTARSRSSAARSRRRRSRCDRDEARAALRAAAGRPGRARLRRQPRRRARSTRLAVDAWGADGPAVLHVSGERDYDALRGRVSGRTTGCCRSPTTSALRSPPPTSSSRARAGSVWELAAAGRPAILVPYPDATADHQTKNARVLRARGRRRDRRATARRPNAFPRSSRALLADPARLAEMGAAMRAAARPDAAERIAGGADRRLQPLAGRRHLDRRDRRRRHERVRRSSRTPGARRSPAGTGTRRRTSRRSRRAGIEVDDRAASRTPPDGWEVVVSTAFAGRVEGRPRADLLAELVSLRRSIVVAGAHGKTTTTAMIAFVPRPARARPGLADRRRDRRSSAATRGAGEGWLVVEGDESDRSSTRSAREIAVLSNVDLDHHATFASRGRGRGALRGVARPGAARRPRRGARSRSSSSSRCPVSTTAGTRPRRSRRSSSPASRAADAEARDRRVHGSRPAARARGRGGRRRRLRRLRAQSRRSSRVTLARRGSLTSGRVLVALPAAPLLAHAPPRARARASRSPRRTRVCVTDIYPAREEPLDGRDRASSSSTRSREVRAGCGSPDARASRTALASSRLGASRATSCSRSAPASVEVARRRSLLEALA